MAEDRNYFIFNKAMDYRRGQISGLIFEDGVLRPSGEAPGYFLSRLLDSREKETVWHRLRLALPEGEESCWKLQLYSSDRETVFCETETMELRQLLSSETIPIEQKLAWMEPMRCKTIQGQRDVLLHDVKGRYLWFFLQSVVQEGEMQGIGWIRLDFPKRSLITYLPEVYQRGEKNRWFLERYLGIFQSLYEDTTEAIEQIAGLFDPDSTSAELLSWMAEWIALEDVPIWNEDQLRYLVKNAMKLYRIRGTGEYLKTMIRLYTGCEAYIVEQHQIERFQNNLEQTARLREMYGDSACRFTVLVNTGTAGGKKEYQTIAQIVEHGTPAHMECRVVVLQPYVFLDQHSYLGVNSYLSQYRPMQLDGLSAMHFARIEK